MIDKPLDDWKPGDEITTSRLNAVNDAVRAKGVRVDGASGLESRQTSYGVDVRARRRQEIWVKITSAGSGGAYGGTQQIESNSSGSWVDGPLVFTSGSGRLREANASTAVTADGTKIVRAWKARYTWRFEWGACS